MSGNSPLDQDGGGTWQRREVIGNATLYLGDCREVLPALGGFDLIDTDPPYGIGADRGAGGGGTDASGRYARRPKQYAGGWDGERPDAATFQSIVNAGKHAIIWGGNYFADLLPQGGRWLFWDKLNSMPSYSDGEMAWTNIPGASVKKFAQCNNGLASLRDGERVHPTQKPVNVMLWSLTFAPKARTVCDPFMGSGSTGVAAVQDGRLFTGIERDPAFFDIACRRIEDAQRQGNLFGDAA
ncbi:MAG: DNA methyltransferase [Sphingomonas phyllosphaerae]|uniref:DNA methyltransferase n=1 Tax=Sphingomonas phyllosphaerae TaxID=257003 RepID=UPI002FF5EEBC